MIEFNARLVKRTRRSHSGKQGCPLGVQPSDLTRWCEAVLYHYNVNPNLERKFQPESVVQLIYADRMRTLADKEKVGRDIRGDL
ncbi:hypothetical protein NQ318_010649 [Aromia moschata]|uniref:Midasin AAA lid domain-containing protein n=1 Tax=Aromia moschata TaxID=1265417 RepID=A0AAV8XCA4_9CUCU|nr:hypothetical protein NQ318_010649 [Aromia moschata]